MLRMPTYDEETNECTLSDLRHCHHTAINRIEHGKPLKTVDKPKVFDRVLYTSPQRPIGRPHAVFKLLDANDDAYRYPHAKLVHIAGMVRHAAIERMKADPPSWINDPADWINRVVRGKRDESSADEHRQFSYVPLPSIGHEHADAMIRNVMVVAPLGMDRELDYLSERLSGEVLNPRAMANRTKVIQSLLFWNGSRYRSSIQQPASSSRLATSARRPLADRHSGHSRRAQQEVEVR